MAVEWLWASRKGFKSHQWTFKQEKSYKTLIALKIYDFLQNKFSFLFFQSEKSNEEKMKITRSDREEIDLIEKETFSRFQNIFFKNFMRKKRKGIHDFFHKKINLGSHSTFDSCNNSPCPFKGSLRFSFCHSEKKNQQANIKLQGLPMNHWKFQLI